MHKLVLILRQNPALPDLAARWSQEFVPLAERLPGLQRVVVSQVEGGPAGAADVLLIHELYFSDRGALTAAMTSPPGVAAGQCLVRITRNAPNAVSLLFAEHMEDVPRPAAPDSDEPE